MGWTGTLECYQWIIKEALNSASINILKKQEKTEMEKILLNDGEELKLMLTMRNAVDYEKETGDHSISRLVTSFAQGQTPTLEEMNKVIYIAHKGVPNQKQYTLDEMIDALPMDLSTILDLVYSLISQKAPKKGNSKKRLKE